MSSNFVKQMLATPEFRHHLETEADRLKARVEYLTRWEYDRRLSLPASKRIDPKPVAPAEPERFTAWCMCPKCGRMDCHWLREPLPKPDRGPVRTVQDGDRSFEVVRWDGLTGPDESMYEVIRICTGCGKEWGQI